MNFLTGRIIAWADRIWTIVVYQLQYLIDFLDFIDRLAVWTPLWALLGEQRVSRPTSSNQPICNQLQETIFQHKNQFTEIHQTTQNRKHQSQLPQSNRLWNRSSHKHKRNVPNWKIFENSLKKFSVDILSKFDEISGNWCWLGWHPWKKNRIPTWNSPLHQTLN